MSIVSGQKFYCSQGHHEVEEMRFDVVKGVRKKTCRNCLLDKKEKRNRRERAETIIISGEDPPVSEVSGSDLDSEESILPIQLQARPLVDKAELHNALYGLPSWIREDMENSERQETQPLRATFLISDSFPLSEDQTVRDALENGLNRIESDGNETKSSDPLQAVANRFRDIVQEPYGYSFISRSQTESRKKNRKHFYFLCNYSVDLDRSQTKSGPPKKYKREKNARIDRFKCSGKIVVRIAMPPSQGRPFNPFPNSCSIQVRYEHSHIHKESTIKERKMPHVVKDFVRDHLYESPHTIHHQLLRHPELSKYLPNITAMQIYNEWKRVTGHLWKRAANEFDSTMKGISALKEENFRVLEVISQPGVSVGFLTPFFFDERVDIRRIYTPMNTPDFRDFILMVCRNRHGIPGSICGCDS
jgi:hypothetical protein